MRRWQLGYASDFVSCSFLGRFLCSFLRTCRATLFAHRSVLAIALLCLTLMVPHLGCSTLKAKLEQIATPATGRQLRQFSIDNTWVRATTTQDYLGFRRLNRFSPIALDRMIIQGNSIDGVSAYDRKNGKLIWRMTLENGVEGGAAVASSGGQDKLYFGASNGDFYCLNVADGKVLWSTPVRTETLAAPTVDEGVVYFQTGTDVVYALDAETGKQLWVYNRQVTGNFSIRATSRPTVYKDKLLVGFSDGFVVALKKRDGGVLWERKISQSGRFRDVDSTPIVDEGQVFVSSYDGALVALELESGDRNWTIERGGYVPVSLQRDRIYYATTDGEILFLDKKSGKQISAIRVNKGIATQPILFKGLMVYGESEGALVVADAETGAPVGRFESGLGLLARPTVLEGSGEAFFISNSAHLYAMKLGYKSVSDRLPWQN
jgi:outer membrane protein assembly factor BamB